jgi:hypothetical protein
MMSKYLVFLDIDGVLASARCQFSQADHKKMWCRLDPIAVEFLSKIADTFEGVEFVLMSTWRHIDGFGDRLEGYVPHWVESAFSNAGFRGNFAKPWATIRRGVMSRPNEVAAYLEKHPCDDFILFDDVAYDFDGVLGKKRCIHTSGMDGLLFKHMEKAWSIVGMWDRK